MANIMLGSQRIADRTVLREKNDCTVRALMDAMEIPYLEAYGMLLAFGRKKGRGIKASVSYEIYGAFAVAKHPRPNMTVENYVRYICHTGNWIVEVRGHVFAVVSGVIRDINPSANLNCHVLNSWRMK